MISLYTSAEHKLDILRQMYNKHGSETKLRRFNNVLTILVFGLGLYLILMPLWPQINFWLTKRDNQNPYQSSLNQNNSDKKAIPTENKLVIPQMGLDATVYEGKYASTLSKGIWHRPRTSTPDKGGNTVLVAHRFTYRSPAIFYHLDKVKVDDVFSLYWGGKEYVYKVREVKIVEPTAIEVEDSTDEPVLTLYTCTPMWTAKQRLVVVSDLITEPST